jgi:hypothetical protein
MVFAAVEANSATASGSRSSADVKIDQQAPVVVQQQSAAALAELCVGGSEEIWIWIRVRHVEKLLRDETAWAL